jgi:hypothetical protein
MKDNTKSPEYWEGRRAEAARLAVKDRTRAALDAHPPLHDLAAEVSRQLARDNARKQRILQRSPYVARGMDAEELAVMSGRELAERELKDLGITPDGRSVEEQLLDAHHAGRAYARNGYIPGNELLGGNKIAIPGNSLLGSASDTLEGSAVDQFFDNLTRHSAQDAAAGGIESVLDDYINPRE